jgi:hypothetical protein
MGVFEDFKFKFKGKEHSIPSDRIMAAIARVEQHVTLGELYEMYGSLGKVKLTAIAGAYSQLLQMAGTPVSPDVIYQELFPGADASRSSPGESEILGAIIGLISLMMPPETARKAAQQAAQSAAATEAALADGVALKNGNRRTRRAAASSSNRRSKRHEDGVSPPNSSGGSIQ